jgi:hypothetical protein
MGFSPRKWSLLRGGFSFLLAALLFAASSGQESSSLYDVSLCSAALTLNDADQNGRIDYAEFQTVLRILSPDPSCDLSQTVFEVLFSEAACLCEYFDEQEPTTCCSQDNNNNNLRLPETDYSEEYTIVICQGFEEILDIVCLGGGFSDDIPTEKPTEAPAEEEEDVATEEPVEDPEQLPEVPLEEPTQEPAPPKDEIEPNGPTGEDEATEAFGEDDDDDDNRSNSVGMLIGIAVGIGAVVVLFVGCITLQQRSKKAAEGRFPSSSKTGNNSDPTLDTTDVQEEEEMTITFEKVQQKCSPRSIEQDIELAISVSLPEREQKRQDDDDVSSLASSNADSILGRTSVVSSVAFIDDEDTAVTRTQAVAVPLSPPRLLTMSNNKTRPLPPPSQAVVSTATTTLGGLDRDKAEQEAWSEFWDGSASDTDSMVSTPNRPSVLSPLSMSPDPVVERNDKGYYIL